MTMQRNLMHAIAGHQNVPVNVLNALFLSLEINRSNILDQTLQKLTHFKASLKNPLKIRFIGEPGDDGGGVKKEFFQVIVKEIFHPCRDMFLAKNYGRCYWPNPDSFEAPIMFELVGLVLGLSIYNSTLLDLKFPQVIYKRLLAPEDYQFEDPIEQLKDLDPDMEHSLKQILETKEDLSSLELSFEAESEVFGQKIRHELKPGGSQIPVTQANKQEYCKLLAQWVIVKSIDKQFRAFRRGFRKVVTGSIIELFTPEELQKIICGSETLDFTDLEKATKYESGYTAESPVIRWLWKTVNEMDLHSKKAFLFFVTGSDRAPIGGLKNLKFTIERQSSDSENLPTAHTCSNVLLLPDYPNFQKLKTKLELAIKHNQGFGLI